jgi:hypothetical protein
MDKSDAARPRLTGIHTGAALRQVSDGNQTSCTPQTPILVKSDIRNPRWRPSLSFFNVATIRSQRQAAGPFYLRIAKKAATL